jgi:hypothetical protein
VSELFFYRLTEWGNDCEKGWLYKGTLWWDNDLEWEKLGNRVAVWLKVRVREPLKWDNSCVV